MEHILAARRTQRVNRGLVLMHRGDEQSPEKRFVQPFVDDGVLRSTDGGRTFSEINTGLTTLRTSRGAGVIIDPRDSQWLYVGTEGGGGFKSRDGGASSTAINQGLTNLTVFALAMIPRIRTSCTRAVAAECSRRQQKSGVVNATNGCSIVAARLSLFDAAPELRTR